MRAEMVKNTVIHVHCSFRTSKKSMFRRNVFILKQVVCFIIYFYKLRDVSKVWKSFLRDKKATRFSAMNKTKSVSIYENRNSKKSYLYVKQSNTSILRADFNFVTIAQGQDCPNKAFCRYVTFRMYDILCILVHFSALVT